MNCGDLRSVTIPEGVTTINAYAFRNCTSLTTITIPASVTEIGPTNRRNNVFSGCKALTSIYSYSEIPVAIASTTFNSVTQNATLYIPKGSLEAYMSATGWEKFRNIVEFNVTAIDGIEADASSIEITDCGIQLTAAEGKTVTVYTAGGALVEKIGNYAGEQITLDKGVYIVCVGEKAVKIIL